VANVSQIVAALEPVAQCQGELTVVRTASNVDDELSFALARARSLWHTGQPTEAYAAAESLAKRAAEAGDRVIEADAWLLVGMIARFDDVIVDGRRTWARSALTAALEAGQAVGDPTRMLRAEVLLAGMGKDDDRTTVLAELGRLAARLDASADPMAKWAYHHGSYSSKPWRQRHTRSEPEEAAKAEHARRMLEISTESFGAGHRFVELSKSIAQWQGVTPKLTAAQQQDEASKVAAMFGADSPRAAEELEELARQLLQEDELDEARIELERALVVWTALEGPKSTQVGAVWRRIAGVAWRAGDFEAALIAQSHAIDALEPNPVQDHAGEVDVLSSVSFERAETLLELGRAEEAVTAIEEAKLRSHRVEEEGQGEVRGDLFGRARLAAGDPEGALAEYAAERKTRPASYVDFDIGEGEALLALGRTNEARALLHGVWITLDAVKDREPHEQLQRARAGLALARTLAAIDADDPEIARIATAAAAPLASLPGYFFRTPRFVKLRDALVALSK
jgi:tetratricopeptide (TPR) repeat protein